MGGRGRAGRGEGIQRVAAKFTLTTTDGRVFTRRTSNVVSVVFRVAREDARASSRDGVFGNLGFARGEQALERAHLDGHAGDGGDEEKPAEHVRERAQHVDAEHGEAERERLPVPGHVAPEKLDDLVRLRIYNL